MAKEYMGDSVYANPDDGGVELTTEDGINTDNTIYLEWSVMETLTAFYGKIKGERR